MSNCGLRITVDASQVPWRDSESSGVRWCLLSEPGPGRGTARDSAVLIEMAPGRGYPAHVHRGIEEVLVLAGGYRDERGEHRAGAYVRYEEGSMHAPVALGDPAAAAGPENPACVLYAIARGGIDRVDSPRAGAPRP